MDLCLARSNQRHPGSKVDSRVDIPQAIYFAQRRHQFRHDRTLIAERGIFPGRNRHLPHRPYRPILCNGLTRPRWSMHVTRSLHPIISTGNAMFDFG